MTDVLDCIQYLTPSSSPMTFLSEILDEGSSDEEGGSASGSESDDSEENEGMLFYT